MKDVMFMVYLRRSILSRHQNDMHMSYYAMYSKSKSEKSSDCVLHILNGVLYGPKSLDHPFHDQSSSEEKESTK